MSTALSEGQVVEGKVVASTEGAISIRLTDGTVLKASLEPGVAAPSAGERVAVQLAEPIGADGRVTLKFVQPATEAAPSVAPSDLAARPVADSAAEIAGLKLRMPQLTELLEAFASRLESLSLPVTAKNLYALKETAAAPGSSLPLATEVAAPESLETAHPIPTVMIRAAPLDETNAVIRAGDSAAHSPGERMRADSEATQLDGKSAPTDNGVTRPHDTQAASPNRLTDQAQTRDVSGNAAARVTEVNGTGSDVPAASGSDATQDRSTNAVRHDGSAPPRYASDITDGAAALAKPPVRNGAAVKRATLELPARLLNLERELESELTRLSPDDPKAAEIKARQIGIHTVREHLTDSRLPENRFIYAQIPLTIGNRDSTAELFVYKNPKSSVSKLDPDNAKILLALDLERLGHVETLISVRGKELSLGFCSERAETADLIRRDSIELYEVMSSVGYKLTGTTSEVEPRSTPENAMLRLLLAANEPTLGLDIAV